MVFHRDQPDISAIMLAGLNGLANIDNRIHHELSDNEISINLEQSIKTTLQLPKTNSPSSWAALTVEIILQLQNESNNLKDKSSNHIYSVFLEHALLTLDEYTRYQPASVFTPEKSSQSIKEKTGFLFPNELSIRDNIRIIKISSFVSGTSELIRRQIQAIRENNNKSNKGIIIDLRNNRGGRLDEAVAAADLFISEGTILKTQGRHPDANQHYIATPDKTHPNIPLIILINKATASAAEVLAAAINDHDKGLLLGTHSYGKGSVQRVRYLPNKGKLNITWKELFSPQGFSFTEFSVSPKLCTANKNKISQITTSTLLESIIEKINNKKFRRSKNSDSKQGKDLKVDNKCKILKSTLASTDDYDLKIALGILADKRLYIEIINHQGIIVF
ncbi:S41 family peptidase [Alphaproteobacteria bacterium]|nr:S41 family peptidase [Alphaproteobacteria bacterium]